VSLAREFPTPPSGLAFPHGVFEFTPHGQQFAGDVTVRIPGAVNESLLTAEPGQAWNEVEGAALEGGMLVAHVRHFSYFAAASSAPQGAGTGKRIFFSDGSSLRSMATDGGDLKMLVAGAVPNQYLTAVAVDPSARQVYWTDNCTDQVSRIGYDGTGLTVLYTSADRFSNPSAVAIDVAHGKLFWTEGSDVRSANLDGTQVATIVAGGAGHFPTGLALDAAHQMLYWTDNGTDTVKRADYAGANPVVLYQSADAFSNPRGLAVDLGAGKLFWAEGADLRSCNLDGSQLAMVVQGTAEVDCPDAVALDPVDQLVYWTDNGADAVRVTGYSGGVPRTLFTNPDRFSNPQGIAFDPGQ